MKRLIYLPFIFLLLCLNSVSTHAQTALTQGDIAFLGYNLDGVDDYAFILLADVDAATQINFTDCGWNDGVGFACNTGDATSWTWTAGAPLTCGTVINIAVNNPGFNASIGSVGGTTPVFSGLGDQLFAFQGTTGSPTFLAGMHSNEASTDANWSGSCTNNQTSALPDVLTNGVDAIRLHNGGAEVDNWQYNCSVVSGDVATVRAAINNVANWNNNNLTAFSPANPGCAWSITCAAACTDPDVPTPTASASPVCPGTAVTLDWTGDNLNDATNWHIYTTSCGVGQIAAIPGNTHIVNPAVTTTYFIRGEDGAGCVDESTGLCGSVTVVVQDITNPTITCPGNQVGSVDGSCVFSLPDYTSLATANDNCGAVTVTQVPAPGTNVGVGTTNIVLTATDGSSNTANCNFDVVVSDNTNPTITCPGNQVGSVDASCVFSLPDYTGLATPSDNCPGVVVTQVPAPGTNVSAGTTNIVLTATDGASNTANCNFDVVVSDNTNPTITCPGNQVGNVDGSCVFSIPDYTSLATPADNCPGVVVTQVPAAGTSVGVGTTNIVLTATDANSNTANCNFDVVVSDNINPTIACPGNQVGSVDGSCVFSLPDYTSLATPADNCPGVTVTQVPAPGTNVGVGTTNIVLTATDGSSNTANCNFDVVVSDNTNPTITCPGNQVGSVDASCVFSLPDYTGLATPSDNCPGVVVTQVPAPGTNVSVGTTNIVLTATDGASNTANCNFDVVVSDNTNPTITCPGNQVGSVDGSCVFSIPDYTSLATPADNCPGVVVTQVPAAGTNVGVGTTNIVLTATDANSNTANCNFDVVVSDNTNPTAVCQNISLFLDGTGNGTIVAADIDGGSTDNCPGLTLGASQTAFTCADLGPNNVTLTVTDVSSNTDNCVAVVTVIDTVSPTITCPANQNETPNASCQFTLIDYTGMAIANDNCGSVTVTQSPAASTVISANTTITLTADDGNGNTSQCQFDVILIDGTNPTAVCQNISVFLDGAGNATIVAADIDGGSTDNCAGLTLSASQTSFTCADLGPNNVTLTATDGNSNTDNCVAVVTVLDTTSPIASCQNITVFLDGAGNATITGADVDNGSSDNCGSVSFSVAPSSFTCADLGANNVTLTVDDGNGNTSTCVGVVTVNDTTSPVASCQNITVYLDGSGNASIVAADVDNGSSDNCGAVTLLATPTAFTCADLGLNSVTLTVDDGNGNTANCAATVTVLDTVSPNALCQDITIFLDGAGNATITGADVDGGGTDNCGSVTVTPSQTAFSCADLLHVPTNDLLITGVIDAPLSGGTPKAVELYVVNNIADLSQYGLGSANNGGGTDGEEFTFPAVAATAGTFIYVASEATEFTNWFGFAPDYTNGAAPLINGDDAVELFFMGGVIDVFGDINVDGTGQPWEYLDGWAYRNNATGNDNSTFQIGNWTFSGINVLDGESSNATAATPFPTGTYSLAGGSGLVPVNVVFDDGNGNTSNCTANVTVSDTVSPTITCPGNQTENPDASCNFTLPDYTSLASGADNCVSVTITQAPAAGTVISGTTTITMTATDASGNTSTCQFNVILNDATAPTAVCQNISVYLDGAGNATIVGADLDGGSTDNCSGLTFSASQSSFTCADLGPNNVTLTVTDGNSNTANCVAVVTVLDTISPTAVCQNITAFLDGTGNVTIADADIDGGSTDNCGSVTVSASQTAFTCAELGANNVTLTVDDGNGNTSTCVAVVTVSDTVSPVITCPGNQTQMADASCNISLADFTGFATATDNCGGSPTITQSPAVGTTVSGAGTVQTVTLTADDGNGNTSFCTFDVTVMDTTSPTAVCQNISIYVDGAGNASIVAADIDGGSTDNCGAVTLSASQTSFTCADLGPNNVTLTATDASANTGNCVAVVTVIDTISPVITCPGNQTENPNASCQFVLPDYTLLGTATDNCGGSPTITQSPAAGTTISGTTTITFTADDGNGNTGTCTFDVVLNDAVPPTAVCQNITVYLDAAGNATIVDADLDGGSTDNCSGITFSASQTAFTCADLGSNNVTLTVTDGNSNSTNCVSVVTVIDTIAPTITCPGDDNVTVDASCNATLADYTGLATAVDVCDASPVITQNPAAGTVLNGAGTIQQVWLIAADASGNVDSCSFNVTLDDITAPTITCPANDTVAVDAICQISLADYTGMATTIDNCDANPTVTQNPAAGTTISGSGTLTTVTLYSTDVSGNVDSCSFTVLLADSTAPAITCPVNDTIPTDANCEVTLADYTGLASVIDNCDANPVITQSPAAGMTLSGSGTVQIVTLYATDVDGNVDSCAFDVVLSDTAAPVIACPVNDTVFVDGNCESTLADYTGLVTTTDNCDANPVVTQSPAAGSTINSGTTTITMTSTDADGNFATCTFDVVALDTLAPVITCMIDTTTCDTLFSFALPSAVDNCGVDSVVQIAGIPSGGVYPVGATTNTFVAYDPSGNTDTCSFVVTVDAQSTPSDAGPDQNLCDVTSAILDAVPPSTGQGTWTALNGGTFTNVNDPGSAVTGLTIGTYQFVWTVGQGVCTTSDTVTVIIDAGPDATFTWTESNGVVTFTPNNTNGDYYLWEFGDGSSSAVQSPTYGYNPGTYIVCLTVTVGSCQEQTCDTIDITTSIVEHDAFESFNVYPNPFRDNATIAYTLDGDHDVMVRVVDMQGRQITQVVNGRQSAGDYQYDFTQDGAVPSAGVYFVQLVVDGQVYTLRLIQMN